MYGIFKVLLTSLPLPGLYNFYLKSQFPFERLLATDQLIQSHPGYFKTSKPLLNKGTNKYKGKVILFVKEMTISASEYTTMAFQISPNVNTIINVTFFGT